jgi:signal transduction histidine kinase
VAVAEGSTAHPAAPPDGAWRGRLGVSTYLRLGLLVLCAGLAVLTGEATASLPWLVALLVLGVLDAATRRASRAAVAVLVVELVTLALAITLTGEARSPLLPYLVAPLASAGGRFGNRAAAVATAAAGLLLVGGAVAWSGAPGDAVQAVAVGQWLALGLASGLLAAWSERLRARRSDESAGHAEAQRLLTQLAALAQRLPGSLDLPTAAEGLLDRCGGLLSYERAVVLTRYDGEHLVPVAVRGVDRVPWRDPMSEAGTLRTAWEERRTALDVRYADVTDEGRRSGSTLLAVPLWSADGSLLGLAAFESGKADAFDDVAVAAAETRAAHEAPRLETALLFGDLRHTATLEERERLAWEIHNGLAQDLAYFGFTLDDLRTRLAADTPEHAARVTEMRQELTQMIQDIRLSITDLRSSVGPARGLGTALSSYVRHAGSAGRLTVHLSLRESGFRLPADQEMLLFRLTQAFVTHVRKAGRERNLWVTLESDAPAAALTLEHDGLDADGEPGHWSEVDRFQDPLRDAGGSVTTTAPGGGRFRVEVALTGGTPWRSDSSSSTTTR